MIWWVKASCANGDSEFSNYNTGWRALTAPTNVQATESTPMDEVQITWNTSTGATSYLVYRSTINNSGTAAYSGQSNSSPYNDTSAAENTEYYYWVKASCANGDSVYSNGDSGFRGLGYDYSGLKWATNTVYYNQSYISDYEWQIQIWYAAWSWNNAPANFNLYEGSSYNAWSTYNYGETDFAALTYRYPPDNPPLTLVCTSMNTYWQWSTIGEAGKYDVQTVAVHEFGHWLSLDHVDIPSSVMNNLGNGGVLRNLNNYDSNGIVAIYGQ